MVIALRQSAESKTMFITFVDLTKAFDTVSRNGLCKILRKLGCLSQFLAMVIQLHEDQLGHVRHVNILSRSVTITNGVKQGCVLAPTLFTLFFSMMLQHVTEDLDDKDGVYIRFRTKSHTVWIIVHWPSQQRGYSEKIQRHFEKVPRYMQHCLPTLENTSSQSNELAIPSLPGYHFL